MLDPNRFPLLARIDSPADLRRMAESDLPPVARATSSGKRGNATAPVAARCSVIAHVAEVSPRQSVS